MAEEASGLRAVQSAVSSIHKQVLEIDSQVARLSLQRHELVAAAEVALQKGIPQAARVARCW